MPTPPPPTPSAPDAAATPDANLASYELSGHIVRLTREDGMAIRAALLAEIAKSQVEHRELLLARTRDAAIEIEHGQMRIGSWWLQGRGDELYLMQRMGPHPVALFYGANVRNEAGRWRISSFGPGEIRWQH